MIAGQYNIDDHEDRADWLREMHDLALGIAGLGDLSDKKNRLNAVDRAYMDATSRHDPVQIVPGLVRKRAGVDIGSCYEIGNAEYRSADQAIAVVGRLCRLAIDALQLVVCAGSDLSDAVAQSGALDMAAPEHAVIDARIHKSLAHCMAILGEYERLTRREEDDEG